jgi:signal transduction histidine kinase
MFLLARGEADGLPLVYVPLYLDEVVGEAVRGLRVLADERGVIVTLAGDQDIEFRGDRQLLIRMITNLVDNAIRHARHHVTARAEQGTELAVTVSDDGPGIPDDRQERIFQRFARESSDYTGAGLGLPIAKWIAEAHGGALCLTSSDSQGSTFTVRLPRRDHLTSVV